MQLKALFVVSLFFLGSKNFAMPYKVMSRDSLNAIDKRKHGPGDITYILDYNAVFVTIFKDGTAILRPPVLGGDEGIYFDDTVEMNLMIGSKQFPVKGTGSYWELHKEKALRLPSNINYFLDTLSHLINYNVTVDTSETYLHELSKVIARKIKSKKIKKQIFCPLGIFVGEIVRRKYNAEWKLSPEYSFNMYYIPEIGTDTTRCFFWNTIDYYLEIPLPFDLQTVIRKASEFTPKGKYVTIDPITE